MATSTPPAYYLKYETTSKSKLDNVWIESFYLNKQLVENPIRVIGNIPCELENMQSTVCSQLLSIGVKRIIVESTHEDSLTFSFTFNEFKFYLETYKNEFEEGVDTLCSWRQGNDQLPTFSGKKMQILHQINRLNLQSFV